MKIQRYYQNNFGKMVEHRIIVPDYVKMWCLDEDVSQLEATLAERDAEIEGLKVELMETIKKGAGFADMAHRLDKQNTEKDAEIERLKGDLAQMCTGDIRPVPTSNQVVNAGLKKENAELKKRVEELERITDAGFEHLSKSKAELQEIRRDRDQLKAENAELKISINEEKRTHNLHLGEIEELKKRVEELEDKVFKVALEAGSGSIKAAREVITDGWLEHFEDEDNVIKAGAVLGIQKLHRLRIFEEPILNLDRIAEAVKKWGQSK